MVAYLDTSNQNKCNTLYQQKSQQLINKTPKAKSWFDWISVDVSVTDRIWKLCSMTFKSLIFGICRAAMFLVLKSVDSYKKIISWQASLCFTTYPIFCLKNNFVPLLARRGSKLRCCAKLHVGQHWALKEWTQTKGKQPLHNMRTKSNSSTTIFPSFP